MWVRLTVLLVASAAAAPVWSAAPVARGWKAEGEAATYDRATIWQAINGAAGLFVSYGFRSMRAQAYVDGGRRRVTAQVYDQAAALGAFGIFTRERPPGAAKIGVGGAFAAGGHCLAYKGRFYVKIITAVGALTRADCAALLARIVGGLPGKGGLPPQLASLPAAGQIAGSAGYTRRSYLGTRRLRRCLHASYGRARGKPYTLFVMLPAPGEAVEAAWRRLARHWKVRRVGGLELLVARIPYRGEVGLARRGRTLIGAVGAGTLEAAAALLRRLPKVK